MIQKKFLKIIVPILILVAAACIWIFKSNQTAPAPSNQEENTSENPSDSPEDEIFSLETNFIDLETWKSYGLPIIIDFGSDYCAPCRQMAPVLAQINEQMQGKAIIKYIDVQKNAHAISDFPIQLIPTQIFINADGTPYVPSEDSSIEFFTYNYEDDSKKPLTLHQGSLTENQLLSILMEMGAKQ